MGPSTARPRATMIPDPESLLSEMDDPALIERSIEAGLPLPGPWRGPPQIRHVRYTHDAMIDLILQNPWVHQNQLANHFGYSPGWISTVMSSDAFKAKLEQRKLEIYDPEVRASMKERFEAVVNQSLYVLQRKLERPDINQIPDNLALRAAEMGAKALGLGGNAPPVPPPPQVDHLSRLAERLVELQGAARNRERTVDVEDARIVEG